MRSAITVIAMLSVLVQSLPGLVMQRCVAMPDSRTLLATGHRADAQCGCCHQGSDGTIECPLAKSGYAGCNCKNPPSEDPKTPPSDHQKSQQIEQLFSTPTPVAAMLLPEPPPAPVRWGTAEPASRCGSHSIQSLLCVWVM